MKRPSLVLGNGSRVGVIGGGPAGSFFSYFLLDMAERAGIKLSVDIFEPRDFDTPGPPGCNMCAGVLHESLVQDLAAEGINLPTTVVQRGMDTNILHMGMGSVRIQSPRKEKRIATTFRGVGPRGLKDFRWGSLDGFLLSCATKKGARHIDRRVNRVNWAIPAPLDGDDMRLQVWTQDGQSSDYDLVAVAAGVNTGVLKVFQSLNIGYQPPGTLKTLVREYWLGEQAVTQYIGPGMHAFLLNLPRIEYAALVPKGDYVTMCLIGHDVDEKLVHDFMNHPAVKECFPADYPLDQFACTCSPRINVKGSRQPYGDRIVFIGDSGVSRLYKNGNGAAFRTGKAAATTAIFHGISADDFKRHYMPVCRSMERDNWTGKLIFLIVRQLQKFGLARQTILRMVADEQRRGAHGTEGMSMILWDMFTGSAHYREIFLRTLYPGFWMRFLSIMCLSLVQRTRQSRTDIRTDRTANESADASDMGEGEEEAMELGALGKVYHDGEVIIRQGEVGACMYVVQEGQVEVVEEKNGQEVRLAVRETGDLFGEMAIFERDVRSATVRALGQARVLSVDAATFLRRVHEDPSIAYRLVKMMSHRIRDLSATTAQLMTNSANDGDERTE